MVWGGLPVPRIVSSPPRVGHSFLDTISDSVICDEDATDQFVKFQFPRKRNVGSKVEGSWKDVKLGISRGSMRRWTGEARINHDAEVEPRRANGDSNS